MHDPYTLLSVAYRAARQVLRNPLLAEEAGERAFHKLTLALICGSVPNHPEAWLRVVAKRSACAMLKAECTKTRSLCPEDLANQQAPYRLPRSTQAEEVRERVAKGLTPRQQDVFRAALSCNTTSAAARSCGMPPRDFRRHLGAITRKARATFAETPRADAFADDASVQFCLPR